jgi:hypothetical protein
MDRQVFTSFTEEDRRSFEPEMKVGLLATVNPQGLPHLTLISTLQASAPGEVCWGQFIEGLSKEYIRQNPKTGFLIMTLDKQLWRGKACFTHTAQSGPDYDRYNSTPMFRYNAYFGIHTVFYMDLVEQYGKEALPMSAVVAGTVLSGAAKTLGRGRGAALLNEWTRALIDKTGNLKFLAYIGEDGYPEIIPVIQAVTAGGERVIFSTAAYGAEIRAIPAGAPAAFFAMSLDMEDVLLRGTFEGVRAVGGLPCGCVKVDWVYNPMPPVPGQVYPPLPLETVREF